MAVLTLATYVCRAFQFLFGIIVLALSASLIHWLNDLENYAGETGSSSDLNYAAFVGVFGMIAAVLGIAVTFVESIPFLVAVVADGLAALFFIAGGGRFASVDSNIPLNFCADAGILTQCQQTQADTAFMFFGFIVSLALVALVFFQHRGKRTGNSAV